MNFLLVFVNLIIIIPSVLTDCGRPGQPDNLDVNWYGWREDGKEGEIVEYKCQDNYRLIGVTERKCVKGKWTGEMPICVKYLEKDLMMEKIAISYLDGNYSHSIKKVSQCLFDSSRDHWDECLQLNKSKNILFNLQFSPPTSVSYVELFFINANETEREVRFAPNISVFLNNKYRKCVKHGSDSLFVFNQRTHFLCEWTNLDDFSLDKIDSTYSVTFQFEYDQPADSTQSPQLSICQVRLFQPPNTCGSPDVPLHLAINKTGRGELTIFYPEDNKYKVIGNDSISCKADGKWFPSPPMAKPITCEIPDMKVNNSEYKIEMKFHSYLNESIVATVGTTLIYNCINKILFEQNLQNFVQICDEDGNWRGQTPKCGGTDKEKEKPRNTQNITLISLVSILSIVVIALLIFFVILVRWKTRNFRCIRNYRCVRKEELRDSKRDEYHRDVEHNETEGEGEYNEIYIGSHYEVINEENQYHYDQIEFEQCEKLENCIIYQSSQDDLSGDDRKHEVTKSEVDDKT